jgi:hypothetical protein
MTHRHCYDQPKREVLKRVTACLEKIGAITAACLVLTHVTYPSAYEWRENLGGIGKRGAHGAWLGRIERQRRTVHRPASEG